MTEWLMTPERVHEAGPKRGLRPGWRLNLSGVSWRRSVLLDARTRDEALAEAARWLIGHDVPDYAKGEVVWL